MHKNAGSIKSLNSHNYVPFSSRLEELCNIVDELCDEPELCEELLRIYEFLSHFYGSDEKQCKFSNCLMFFVVGRLFERDKNCITNLHNKSK